MDLRVRIFDAREAGDTTAEVADRFAVSPAFVRRLMQRHREAGTLAPEGGRRGPAPRLAGDADRIRALAAAEPDLTPAEVRDRLKLAAGPLTVWRAVRRVGLTRKKSRSGRRSATGRT